MSNIPFNIRFSFVGNNPLTEKLYDNIDKIIKHAIDNLPELILLDRCEPSISSLNEKKQLRLSMNCVINNKLQEHKLIFIQHGVEYFDLWELRTIADAIKSEIEECLLCTVDDPEIFICISDM